MRFNLTNLFIALALFIAFSSCQDHRLTPSGQRFRLKKTTFTKTSGGSTVKIFNYNSLGKLSTYSISEIQNDVSTKNYTLLYDSQNILTSIEGRNAAGIVVDRIVYNRNASGDISKVLTYYSPSNDGNLVLRQTDDITYNSDHTPSSVTYTVTGFPSTTTQYTYVDGNIVSDGLNTYTYDTHPNPYYNLVNTSLTLFDISSKNSLGSSGSIYDSNGLVIKRGDVTFEYETY